jgi:hypothetical protein
MDRNGTLKEMAGTFAVVGCEDNPNFQVWGARSDLKCRKKRKGKLLTMSFKDWIGRKGGEKDVGQ